MKGSGCFISSKWNETEKGRRIGIVSKTLFPILLSYLLLKERQQKNVILGFKKCGIYPSNTNENAVHKELTATKLDFKESNFMAVSYKGRIYLGQMRSNFDKKE